MRTRSKQHFVATACIFNSKNQILLTKRHSPHNLIVHNLWQFPGGSIEYGENPRQTALREVFEETGLIIRINSNYPLVDSHVFKAAAHIILMIYSAEYVSGEIDISKDSAETSDAKWFSLKEITQLNCMPKIKEQANKLYEKRTKG